jgi:hypothetical protein
LKDAARIATSPLGVAILTAAAGWIVGNALTARWDLYKKRRELDLASLDKFYNLYGEFFEIWKSWNTIVRQKIAAPSSLTDERWNLLQRAAGSEGRLEALLVKITSERELNRSEVEVLACLRQAHQSLRESIRDGRELRSRIHDSAFEGWIAEDKDLCDRITVANGQQAYPRIYWYWLGSESEPYLAFKSLASYVATLLSQRPSRGRGSMVFARTRRERISNFEALREVTSNHYEDTWLNTTYEVLGLKKSSNRKLYLGTEVWREIPVDDDHELKHYGREAGHADQR